MNLKWPLYSRYFQELAWGGYLWVSLEFLLLVSWGGRERKERKTISAHLAILLFHGVTVRFLWEGSSARSRYVYTCADSLGVLRCLAASGRSRAQLIRQPRLGPHPPFPPPITRG